MGMFDTWKGPAQTWQPGQPLDSSVITGLMRTWESQKGYNPMASDAGQSYESQPFYDSSTGLMYEPLQDGTGRFSVYNAKAAVEGKDKSVLNGKPYYVYDPSTGSVVDQGMFKNMTKGNAGKQFLTAAAMMLPGMGMTMHGVAQAAAAAEALAASQTFGSVGMSGSVPAGQGFGITSSLGGELPAMASYGGQSLGQVGAGWLSGAAPELAAMGAGGATSFGLSPEIFTNPALSESFKAPLTSSGLFDSVGQLDLVSNLAGKGFNLSPELLSSALAAAPSIAQSSSMADMVQKLAQTGAGKSLLGSLGTAGVQALGSYLTGKAAQDGASQTADAYTKAAQQAADAAKFRPVGVTSRFGSSNFQFDENGFLKSAGYSLSPDVAAMRDKMLSQAGGAGMEAGQRAIEGGNSLFSLGSQYVAQSPQEAAKAWMAKQLELLNPQREQGLAQVRLNAANTGRSGLAVGATSDGMMATNPEMAAYWNARLNQDRQLAANADEQARTQITFGSGLMGEGQKMLTGAFSPASQWLGTADAVEKMGSSTLDMGAQLGGRTAQAGSNAGQFLMSGGTNAAQTMAGVNGFSPVGGFLSGLANNKTFQDGLGRVLTDGISSIWK